MSPQERVAEAAQRLIDAAASKSPCAPVRDLLGIDLAAAYAVQDRVVEAASESGGRIVGYKIGLTSATVQQQFGVAQPDCGTLLSSMILGDGELLDLGRFLQPRVEGEVAFVLGAAIENPHASVVDVLRATEFVLPAIEVVDSRIAGWDLSITDTVADNASSGAVVLGTTPIDLSGLDLSEVAMTLERHGEVVSTGVGAACLSSPVSAVAWLARDLARRDRSLPAGSIVLSGAFGPMVDVTGAGRFRLELSGIGHVDADFTMAEAS